MDAILTVGEVARRLSVSEGTVRNLADTDALRAYRTGGLVRQRLFLRDDVEKFAAEREREPKAARK